MKYLFFILSFAFVLSAFGQKGTDEVALSSGKCNCDKVASIDPTTFTIDAVVFKREKPKAVKRRLKLGIQGLCFFVIDSLGKVQPYKIKNYQLSIAVHGGIPGSSHNGHCINQSVLTILESDGVIAPKFFLDNIVVEDSAGREIKGLIEPLTMIKIK
jgi:hypothetical protein